MSACSYVSASGDRCQMASGGRAMCNYHRTRIQSLSAIPGIPPGAAPVVQVQIIAPSASRSPVRGPLMPPSSPVALTRPATQPSVLPGVRSMSPRASRSQSPRSVPNDEDEADDLCGVCYTNPTDPGVACEECYKKVCKECASKLTECPFCRHAPFGTESPEKEAERLHEEMMKTRRREVADMINANLDNAHLPTHNLYGFLNGDILTCENLKQGLWEILNTILEIDARSPVYELLQESLLLATSFRQFADLFPMLVDGNLPAREAELMTTVVNIFSNLDDLCPNHSGV